MKNVYKKGNYTLIEDLGLEKYPYSTLQVFPLNSLGVSTHVNSEIITIYTSANSKVVFEIANSQLLVNGISYDIDEVAEKLMDELTGSTGGGGGITPTSSDGSLTINGNDISVTWLKALDGTTEPLVLYVDENGVEHASIGGKNLAFEGDIEKELILKPTVMRAQAKEDEYLSVAIESDELEALKDGKYHKVVIDWTEMPKWDIYEDEQPSTTTVYVPCKIYVNGAEDASEVFSKIVKFEGNVGTGFSGNYYIAETMVTYAAIYRGGRINHWYFNSTSPDQEFEQTESYVVKYIMNEDGTYDISDQECFNLKAYLDAHPIKDFDLYLKLDEEGSPYELVYDKSYADGMMTMMSKWMSVGFQIIDGEITYKNVAEYFEETYELSGTFADTIDDVVFDSDGGIKGIAVPNEDGGYDYGVFQNRGENIVKMATEEYVDNIVGEINTILNEING